MPDPQTTEELLTYLANQPAQQTPSNVNDLLSYLSAQPSPTFATTSTPNNVVTEIDFTDYYDIAGSEIDEAGLANLSPSEFGITGESNFNLEPGQLNCGNHQAAFCAFNPDMCTMVNNQIVLTYDGAQLFYSNYPECTPSNDIVPQAVNTNNQNNTRMNNEIFDIKSPNFLGGNNVHNVILIVLALLILVAVTKGNLLTAPIKAIKQAV